MVLDDLLINLEPNLTTGRIRIWSPIRTIWIPQSLNLWILIEVKGAEEVIIEAELLINL